MFDDFRERVKKILKVRELTYSQLSELSGLAVSTIKCFMCGANDSRRVAEKIANALSIRLVFQNADRAKTHLVRLWRTIYSGYVHNTAYIATICRLVF